MSIVAGGITLDGVGSVVGILIGLVGAAAIIVAYFRASYAKATIDTLKQSNAALTERVEILEGENERCNAALTAFKAENENLRTYVSGTAAVNELKTVMLDQFTKLGELINGRASN